jgi:hypothetical protein
METAISLPQDIQRIIVSYLDTDSDLYYERVMQMFLPDYSEKIFVNLHKELPKILAIPRYLNLFKNSNTNFMQIYATSKTNKQKYFIHMNNGKSFTTSWILSIYH